MMQPMSAAARQLMTGGASGSTWPWLQLALVLLGTAGGLSGLPLEAGTRVTMRVVDAQSREPLPARVYLRSDAGAWHFVESLDAAGSAVRYDVQRGPSSVEKHTTVSAHPFEADLEPGSYTLTVERGKEYLVAERQLSVGTEPLTVTIALRRWIDMGERGWYSGDTHVHRRLDDLPNLLLAEDLNVALPLTHWVTRAHASPALAGNERSADQSAPVTAKLVEVDSTHVFSTMNTEYEIFTVGQRRHTLGAVFVLNHRVPLDLGVPPVAPVAEEARRQGALLDLDKHSWPWSMMLVPVMKVDLFELANNHVWRTGFHFRDWTIETRPPFAEVATEQGGWTEWGWVESGFVTYYALLNCGFRLQPTAGTASGVHPVPLGFGRVYVSLPDGFTFERWMDGLKAGRSFVTTGPMLFGEFRDRPPGTVFRSADAAFECPVRARVASARPIERIEVIINGDVVETLTPHATPVSSGGFQAVAASHVTLRESGWVALRCFERVGGRLRFAHTAPVHVELAGRPLRPRRREVVYFVERMRSELARNADVLAEPELEEYRRALSIYEELLETAR